MVTVTDFVVQLLVSVLELVVTFVLDVFLGVDPLSAVSFLVGAAIVGFSSLFFGYLVFGAALNAVSGFGASAPDARQRQRA